jgi:hypothetical protein
MIICNYIIIINVTASSGTNIPVNLRLAAGGTPASGAGIYEVGKYFVGARTAITANTNDSVASNLVRLGRIDADGGMGAKVVIYNPFTADKTKLTTLGVGETIEITGAALTVTDSYDGVQILTSSGTMTGTITVYGIKES